MILAHGSLQVRPLYRYSATLLGASMWFFVSSSTDLERSPNSDAAHVPSQEGRSSASRMEASMGTLELRQVAWT